MSSTTDRTDDAIDQIRVEIRELRRDINRLWTNGLRELGERVAAAEKSVGAAHCRLDEFVTINTDDHRNISAQLRSLWWRVALLVGGSSMAAQLLLLWWEKKL